MADLPATSSDGLARASALGTRVTFVLDDIESVTYRSAGRVLVVGEEEAAAAAARALGEGLQCTLLVPGAGVDERGWRDGLSVIRADEPALDGYLGHYLLTAGSVEEPAAFDLVLDLGATPLIDRQVPPVGYYATRGDEVKLGEAQAALTDMIGEFEKPRFFAYDPEICAHGRSGQRGCTRCLDACPAEAIISVGDTVEVNPYLCQGVGACVAACPSGAMRYAFPAVTDLLGHVRLLLKSYRAAGGEHPRILFHDGDAGAALLETLAPDMPESVIPVQIEEIGATGLDTWLTCLAYGAGAVALLLPPDSPAKLTGELATQIGFGRAMIGGLGLPPEAICLIETTPESAPAEARGRLDALPDSLLREPANYTAPDEKRTIIRLAMHHLAANGPIVAEVVPLPAGAPFGQVNVDRDACTLCMGCVSVCPADALQDGQGRPQLRFVEWNCVQCGLCERACPEDAISLEPRFLYDPNERQRTRILNEEEPFCCVVCGKAFATASVIDAMRTKLAGHWMFQDEASMRRLQMCDNCRVADIARAAAGEPAKR
jgi:ferredoxin